MAGKTSRWLDIPGEILFVNQNPDAWFYLFKTLARERVVTEPVESVEEAIHRIQSKPYAMILLDLQYPGDAWCEQRLPHTYAYHGVELADYIRSHDSPNKGTKIGLLYSIPLDEGAKMLTAGRFNPRMDLSNLLPSHLANAVREVCQGLYIK